MSDDDLNDDDSPTVTLKRSEIRALEKKAKLAEELEQTNGTLSRKLAFAEAGINLSDSKSKYFVNGYDGELTADAIKAAAIADGFLADPAAAEAQTDQAQTSDALGRMAEGAATALDAPDAAFDAVLSAGSREEFYARAEQAGLVI